MTTRGRFGAFDISRGFPLPVDEAVRREQNGKQREAEETVHARESSAKAYEQARGNGSDQQHGNRPERDDGAHRDWPDQHGDSEDGGDVEDVRAVGVAEREIGVAGQSGQRGNGEFRGRRSKPDDHHPDDERRYAQRAGDGLGSLDETVGAPRKNAEADDNKRKRESDWNLGIHQVASCCGSRSIILFIIDGRFLFFGRILVQ